LLRYLEECEDTTIDEVALAASCLAALAGDRRARVVFSVLHDKPRRRPPEFVSAHPRLGRGPAR